MKLRPNTPAVAKPLSFRFTSFPSVHVSLDEQFVNSITSVRTFVPIYYVYGSRLFVAFKFDLRLSCKLMKDKRIRTACKHTDRRKNKRQDALVQDFESGVALVNVFRH
jgi:hypothetical protein